MEVLIPGKDFDFFTSACSTPRVTAPSTPKQFAGGDYYLSAPTSPTHLSQFYSQFDDFLILDSPKSSNARFEDDFAFDVSGDLNKSSVFAEELFDGGVIRPLGPPSPLRFPSGSRIDGNNVAISPRSPGYYRRKIRNALSQKQRQEELDPAAMVARNSHERGRERTWPSSLSRTGHRSTRSLSPFRVSDQFQSHPSEEDEEEEQEEKQQDSKTEQSRTSFSKGSSSKKWRLKDLFLFRSASEGRVADGRDPLKKHTAAIFKNTSFRAIERPGSGPGSSMRRGRPSAHELHYTVNRAVSEDLKKKTFLPYKQGILGRLAFNPAVHALANGFGFSRK